MSKFVRTLINASIVLSMLLSTGVVTPSSLANQNFNKEQININFAGSGLFRTHVTLPSAASRARLDELGVLVLAEGVDTAIVLATGEQLETLARLRFQPRSSDELGVLVEAHRSDKPWLANSLARPLANATAAHARSVGGELTKEQAEAASLEVLAGLTQEQEAGILNLTSVDDDADGLTNTQESWWCTDPLKADTDGDGATDGEEVQAAKDWLNNIAPSYPATGKPFQGWPPNIPNCFDDDNDSIPDLAEVWELGLNPNRESTDRDKFDDGQELFGTTHCPTGGSSCGYGALPRDADWGVVFAEMPSWVERPGDHPLVAAYPIPKIDVVPSTLVVETVVEVTTDHIISAGTEQTYSTAKTEGTSTSVADTTTWNEWQEVSRTDPIDGMTGYLPLRGSSPGTGYKVSGVILGFGAALGVAACVIVEPCVKNSSHNIRRTICQPYQRIQQKVLLPFLF